MKIPLTNGRSIETDKLTDKSAAIHEAINHLYLTCEKFNVVGFAKVVLQENEGLGMLFIPQQSEDIRSEEYSKLISSLADWIDKTSGGRLQIIDKEEEDGFSDVENQDGE
jgi:hypothetical protein